MTFETKQKLTFTAIMLGLIAYIIGAVYLMSLIPQAVQNYVQAFVR